MIICIVIIFIGLIFVCLAQERAIKKLKHNERLLKKAVDRSINTLERLGNICKTCVWKRTEIK